MTAEQIERWHKTYNAALSGLIAADAVTSRQHGLQGPRAPIQVHLDECRKLARYCADQEHAIDLPRDRVLQAESLLEGVQLERQRHKRLREEVEALLCFAELHPDTCGGRALSHPMWEQAQRTRAALRALDDFAEL